MSFRRLRRRSGGGPCPPRPPRYFRQDEDVIVTGGAARFRGRVFPISLGRGGISAQKREGDGATPSGVLRITGCLYRPDRMSRPNGWAMPIGPRDLWCDDPEAADYNHWVRVPFGASHERLRRADPLYDLVLLTDWNWPNAVPGRGSAIFVHQWRKPRHPTEGCIALRRDHLCWLAARLRPGTRLIVHQP